MSEVTISSTGLGNTLQQILNADDIQPGDEVSYQVCKAIFISHPLGSKMTESPIRRAQSQERDIAIPDSPEEEVKEAFQKKWEEFQFSRLIMNCCTQGRVYGVTTLGLLDGADTGLPVDLQNLWRSPNLTFNIFDPLNTAGSMTTNQDPNSPLFQKWGDITVAGRTYHRSRTTTFMNEESLYIAWTNSAYGYTGRSVYQRVLYPLKSFLQSMITDDMVTRKAGLLVARLDQAGTIVDRVMQSMAGVKRSLLRLGSTNNVLSIGKDEIIETLNLTNVNSAMSESRNNIIKNIAAGADMPAKMLTQEAYVEGFGEGTQDAYAEAAYIDRLRIEMRPQYRWCDTLCQYLAWTPEFYETIQRKYPDEYGNLTFNVAFYRWCNSFSASWPSLIKEKPSEAVEIEDIRIKAVMAYVQVFAPMMDGDNRARMLLWAIDQINAQENIFGAAKLVVDDQSLSDFLNEQVERETAVPPQAEGEGQDLSHQEGSSHPPHPMADSTRPFNRNQADKAVSVLTHRLRGGESVAEAFRQ